MTTPDPTWTALEAIRVSLRGDDVAPVVAAELNELASGEISPHEVLEHALTSVAICARMAAAALQRCAQDTGQAPDDLYRQLRRAYLPAIDDE